MTVLSVTGILCKLIGVLYSIPLTRILGADGLGIYYSVYPTYNLLLTVSSAGLPVAVSRMVSSALATENPRGAKQVFRTALLLLTAIGLGFTLLMIAGTPLLVARVGNEETRLGFYAIAPCVAIVCALSAYRGFMQGQQNMVPTAVSQLIEQLGKVAIALPLSWFGMKRGLAWGAAAALLGTTVVEFLALLFMILRTRKPRLALASLPQRPDARDFTAKQTAGLLMRVSIPITISACIVPLAGFIDSGMLVSRMMAGGLERTVATRLYGLLNGPDIRLINIPTALALAVAMSVVPAIAAAKASEDAEGIRRQSDLALRFAFLIGLPCTVGMSVLSHEIVTFFYEGSLSAEHLATTGDLLAISACTIVFFTVVQATSGILQGLHRQRLPMYTLVAGVAMKILLNYTLVAVPSIGIKGAPVASIVCYVTSMVPNLIFVCKYGDLKFNWTGWILKPCLAAAAMGLAVWGLKTLLPQHRLITILLIAAGIAVYAAAALLCGAMTRDDFRMFLRRGRKKA